MLTRRTFIQNTGVLAAAAAGGMNIMEPEIKEYGIVEIRFWFLTKDPFIVKSTIFSDKRRDVFGVRTLGGRGPYELRLAELRLSAVRAAVLTPRRDQKCAMTGWNAESGKPEEGSCNLVVMGGHLVVSGKRGGTERVPVWMSLVDVQQVL